MHFLTGTQNALSQNVVSKMASYRHRVFVDKLGWQLNCVVGRELDQFDREDTVYVIAEDDLGDVVGTARLLPTNRPYLLGEIFPQLMGGSSVPSSPLIWELSRLQRSISMLNRLGRWAIFLTSHIAVVARYCRCGGIPRGSATHHRFAIGY
jgi:acyl homoserine lactone synthase